MKISVCMPTYNGEKYIYQQLRSILDQLSNDDEIIISDDSSNDRTIDIINSLNDRRIKIYTNNLFHNPVYNLEFALKKAKGDVIFLSDQDDVWISNKVEIFLKHLKDHDLVVSDSYLINEYGDLIRDSFFYNKLPKKNFIYNLYKNPYHGCCIAFNRKILEYSLPFPRGLAMHDIFIGLLAELNGKVKFIPDKLIYFRRHSNSLTSSGGKSKHSIYYRIKIRAVMFYILFKRTIKIKINSNRASQKY